MGKKLKKNNVAVDILCLGELDEENMAKIEAFIGAVNSNDNSHLVTVPTGAALVDCMLSYAPRIASLRSCTAASAATARSCGCCVV
jgi:26S proteasome regulatory subunit N10